MKNLYQTTPRVTHPLYWPDDELAYVLGQYLASTLPHQQLTAILVDPAEAATELEFTFTFALQDQTFTFHAWFALDTLTWTEFQVTFKDPTGLIEDFPLPEEFYSDLIDGLLMNLASVLATNPELALPAEFMTFCDLP